LNQNILRYLTVVRDPRNEGRIRPSEAVLLDDPQDMVNIDDSKEKEE
jgi:hypothetical protein